MYIINPAFILANYFLHSSEPINFGKLREIRQALESNIKEWVYADISTPSLARVIEVNSKMFQWKKGNTRGEYNTIVKADGSDSMFNEKNIKDNFDWMVEEKYRQRVLDIMDDLRTSGEI